MKAVIEYSSDYKGCKKRIQEINSLEELFQLQKKEGYPLIIKNNVDTEFTIEVYDEYRE